TVEKGIDVRESTLLAFGGAGPLHAAELARELGIREVLVPPMAGMFSALGILLSDVRLDLGETLLVPWDEHPQETIDRILNRFKQEAVTSLKRQGVNLRNAQLRPILDLRFRGQSFHLSVPYNKQADMVERFRQAFKKRYGYALDPASPVEVVAVRLSATASRGPRTFPRVEATNPSPPIEQRKILLPSGWHVAPVYQRKQLWQSFRALGPVVIEDEGCTVFVPPEFEVSVETNTSLKIEVG
ncbi:MAG: hydantoinase/oxoprolinase family protein, partial [Deltaproteobacteria bacterium]